MWGITASSASAVITISWSSLPPVQPTGFYSGTTQPNVNNFTVIGASSGSTLFTPANVADGVALGSAITTSSIVTISQSVRWLKARVNTLTGGYVTANAQGNG
jgi:hypothetical protein